MKTKIRSLEKRLGIDIEQTPITYWMMLVIDKKKSFEEMLGNNDGININKGKEFLGRRALTDLPKRIYNKLKKIYQNTQNEIKNDSRIGGSLAYVNIKE